jgi:hypothetical protein
MGAGAFCPSTGFREVVYSIEYNPLLLQTYGELYRVF